MYIFEILNYISDIVAPSRVYKWMMVFLKYTYREHIMYVDFFVVLVLLGMLHYLYGYF